MDCGVGGGGVWKLRCTGPADSLKPGSGKGRAECG